MRPRISAVTSALAWVGVHRWRPAAALLALTAVTALLTRTAAVHRLGAQPLVNPVAVALLLPVVAAVAVAVACAGPRLGLPNPSRNRRARLAWLGCWTGLAALVILMTLPTAATPAAIVRNLVIDVALALVATVRGHPELAWILPVLLTTSAMQFGGTDSGHVWWAVVIDADSSRMALLAAAGLFAAATVAYLSSST